MEVLFRLLVPLVFVGIVIINALVRMKQFQKDQEKRLQGKKPPQSAWNYIADTDEIKKFLEQTTGAKSVAPPAPRGRSAAGGPMGLPEGTVRPTGRRTARAVPPAPSAQRPALRATRAPEPLHKVPGENVAEVERHPRTEKPHFKTHQLTSTQGRALSTITTKYDRAPDEEVQKTRAKPAPKHALGSTVEESASLVPELTRGNLRRAIVMSEVLGAPVAFRGPIA